MTSRALGALGRFFITTGVVLLLFAAFQLWGTGIQEARAQGALENEFDEVLDAAGDFDPEDIAAILEASPTIDPIRPADPDQPGAVEAASFDPELLRYFYPDGGEPIARLQMPTIGVDKIVVEGVNVEDLRQGPGRYVSTSMACQAGNAAIAGHRTTYGAPFHNIDQLRVGDEITVQGRLGECTYRVIAPEKQNWGAGEYCDAFDQARTERLSAGIISGALTEGLIELDFPDDFAVGATDDITYFDTSNQQVGDAAPIPTTATDEPGWFVVDPRATCVIENYGDNRLTLTACHPKYTARQRIIVQAVLVDAPLAPASIRPNAPTADLASEFDDPTSDPAEAQTSPSSTPPTSAATATTAPDAVAQADTPPVPPVTQQPVDASVAFENESTLDAGLGWSWEFLPGAIIWGLITLALWIATRVIATRWKSIPTYALAVIPVLICLYFTFEKVDKVLPAY